MDLLDKLTLGRESYQRQAWAAAYQSLSHAGQGTLLEVEDLELLATSAYLSGREDEFLRVCPTFYTWRFVGLCGSLYRP
jgi:hypothetical protein